MIVDYKGRLVFGQPDELIKATQAAKEAKAMGHSKKDMMDWLKGEPVEGLVANKEGGKPQCQFCHVKMGSIGSIRRCLLGAGHEGEREHDMEPWRVAVSEEESKAMLVIVANKNPKNTYMGNYVADYADKLGVPL
jgi:hypothetical protein